MIKRLEFRTVNAPHKWLRTLSEVKVLSAEECCVKQDRFVVGDVYYVFGFNIFVGECKIFSWLTDNNVGLFINNEKTKNKKAQKCHLGACMRCRRAVSNFCGVLSPPHGKIVYCADRPGQTRSAKPPGRSR